MAPDQVVLDPPYIYKTGTPEEVTWFPLPPSYVLFDHGTYYGIWLLHDEPPESREYTASSSQRVYHQRPDLRYSYRDWQAANAVDAEVTHDIMVQHHHDDRKRIECELAVISALREAGMAADTIKLVFKEQAIGDPYRPTGSLIGSLTMADELLRDVMRHEDQLLTWTDGYELWFNLANVIRWWYASRRERGQRILPERELRALLRSNPGGYWLGQTYKPDENNRGWMMFGVDLELAKKVGVIEDANKEG